MSTPNGLRAWAEIDLGALAHNIQTLQTRYSGASPAAAPSFVTGIMAIVKADAYGHGIDLVAPCAYANGVRHFGVASTDEALYLRRLLRSDANLYVLSPVIPSDAPAIVSDRIIAAVSSIEMAEALSQAAQQRSSIIEEGGQEYKLVDYHLDIDTGMGRAGFTLAEASAALAQIDALPGLRLAGVCTHFASADEDPDDARAQHKLFLDFLAKLGDRASRLSVHASNSPATLVLGPPSFHTLVRPGLLMYGIEPAPGMLSDLDLRPVLGIKASVTLCRDLEPGATISYGKTYAVPPGGGRYATIAVGYGDGYPRPLGNIGHVLLNGRRAEVRGRVCMDQLVVDATGIGDVRAGDVATIIGRDGDEVITIGAVASLIQTTPHLISTCLLPRLPRIALKG